MKKIHSNDINILISYMGNKTSRAKTSPECIKNNNIDDKKLASEISEITKFYKSLDEKLDKIHIELTEKIKKMEFKNCENNVIKVTIENCLSYCNLSCLYIGNETTSYHTKKTNNCSKYVLEYLKNNYNNDKYLICKVELIERKVEATHIGYDITLNIKLK